MSKPIQKDEIAAVERALALVKPTKREPLPKDDLPDADQLADDQHEAAVNRIHEDKSDYPRFHHLESVYALTGSFAPEEVIMAGAEVQNGKSLFFQNLFDDLTDHETPTLYIGTEQSDYVLKIKHACLRCGVSPKLILKPTPEEENSLYYEEALQLVQAQLEWLGRPEMRELAFYANTEYVNREILRKWITGGVKKYGIETVIVDHIDQVKHGDGQNSPHELAETVQLLLELARLHQMPVIVASQLKRRLDPIRKHSPPELDDFAGSSSKERVSSIMLGLWRPLRTDLSVEELRDLKKNAAQGSVGQDKIYQENTMGVRLLKDRLGSVPGKQVMLHVGKGGKLSDDSATTHGIRTGGIA
jgi:hypothetical protein